MIIKNLIQQLMQGKELRYEDIKKCSNAFLKGGATPAQISSFLTAMVNKKLTKKEFEGLIDGINMRANLLSKIRYDFYIYSYIQDNLSIALCFVLSEFQNLIYAKFKNLYLENVDVLSTNNNKSEQELVDEHKLFLSVSEYNKILKNILFLKSELGFDHLINLLELSILPVNFKYNLTMLDSDKFLELNSIYNLSSIFGNKIFLVFFEDKVKLIKIGKSNVEKLFYFSDLEKYNLLNFTKVILDEKFINFCMNLIEEIYILNDMQYDFKRDKSTCISNLSKNIIQKYIKYFEIIKYQ